MNEYKVDHLSNKIDFVTTQFMELKSIQKRESNEFTHKFMELQSTHKRESNELNNKIMELQQVIVLGHMQLGIDDSKRDTNEVCIFSKTFEYKNDFDENGVLYFLGCNYGKSNWGNPSQT
eukprot:324324_1